MKKIYLMALAVFFGASLMAQIDVTFQVDMNNETVSENGVHVAGDWQSEAGFADDWQPDLSEMTDPDSDGIYSLTVTLDTVGQFEYKFINGNGWDAPNTPENIPLVCQRGNGNSNRVFNVNAWHANTENLPDGWVLPAVVFGGSAPMGQVAVRLQVDMTNQLPISDLGVHVAGNFTNPEWTPQLAMPFLISDAKYAYVANVDPEMTYVYKYLNGDFWGTEETVPAECNVEDNRTVEVASEDVTTDSYCFGTCSTCAPQTEVTFKVDLSGVGGGNPDGVSVAGSFQGWSPGSTLMTDDDEDDIYEVTLMLDQGTYEYKFVNGITWDGGESVPASCNVNGNREVVVGEEPVTEAYCFGQCTAECIPDPAPSDITFRVDMQNEIVAPEGVWVMGGFTDPQWQSGAIEMMDTDEDGVYEVTVNDVSGPSEIQYKFANGDPQTTEENADFLTGGCGVENGVGGYNRTFDRTENDTILDVVCYNSCTSCSVGIQEASLGEVSIYPNPSHGKAFISIENPNAYTLRMNIVDITGKVVRETTVLKSTRFELNTSDLNAGLYFLNIVNEQNESAVYKLMVE